MAEEKAKKDWLVKYMNACEDKPNVYCERIDNCGSRDAAVDRFGASYGRDKKIISVTLISHELPKAVIDAEAELADAEIELRRATERVKAAKLAKSDAVVKSYPKPEYKFYIDVQEVNLVKFNVVQETTNWDEIVAAGGGWGYDAKQFKDHAYFLSQEGKYEGLDGGWIILPLEETYRDDEEEKIKLRDWVKEEVAKRIKGEYISGARIDIGDIVAKAGRTFR